MKRITLSTFTFTIALVTTSGALGGALAGAQTRPAAPPAPPSTPAEPRAIAPRIDEITREEIRATTMAARADMMRVRDEMAEQMRAANFDMERALVEAQRTISTLPALASLPPIPSMPAFGAMTYDNFEHRVPPKGWAQSDPADSLYNAARDVVNRGDWGRAARMFNDIQKRFPNSAYEKDAQYWEAFARYKIGTTDELHQAAKILEPIATRLAASGETNNGRRYGFSEGRRTSDSEILSLYTRINGVLAQRGDADAAAKVAKAAQQGGACDQEDLQVRSEALSALSQMDPNQAVPMLRRVLDHKDECSASLRRNAVLILSRRTDADAINLLLQTAKTDPNITVRSEAVSDLSRIPGDAGVNALEDILRSEQDERIQRAAVRGLMASDNAKARSSMRSLIDRKDAPLNLRIEALGSFSGERATADDAAYLRSLYGRADNDRLKDAVVNALARIGGTENEQFLLGIVRNNNEPGSARSAALARLARSSTLSTNDLAKLYDASAESYDIRSRIISILGSRKDQEATDKLIEIVKNSTVINHRTQAINALTNKKDPRATQALMDILDGKKG